MTLRPSPKVSLVPAQHALDVAVAVCLSLCLWHLGSLRLGCPWPEIRALKVHFYTQTCLNLTIRLGGSVPWPASVVNSGAIFLRS